MDLQNLDYRALQFWVNALQLLGLAALFVYTHFTNKSKVNATAINNVRGDLESKDHHLEGRIVRCERRQDVFESKQDGALTHEDLSNVYHRLNEVAEDLSGVSGQMRALSHQLSMVNQYLLNNKGGNP